MFHLSTWVLTALFLFFFFLALIEGFLVSRRTRYDWREFAVSSADLFIRLALIILIPYSIVEPLGWWVTEHAVFKMPLDSFWSLLLLFVGVDFCYYVMHFVSHKVRWFWIYHAAHHTPRQINIATGYRLGILDKFIGIAAFFAVLVWLGYSIAAVQFVLTLNVTYQLLVHVHGFRKVRIPGFEYIFNTPSNHRVHHAYNRCYRGRNYGGTFIIFDRLFGTYAEEREDKPCIFTDARVPQSYNPLTVEFREVKSLFVDLVRARSPRAWFAAFVMPPRWPDEPQA